MKTLKAIFISIGTMVVFALGILLGSKVSKQEVNVEIKKPKVRGRNNKLEINQTTDIKQSEKKERRIFKNRVRKRNK